MSGYNFNMQKTSVSFQQYMDFMRRYLRGRLLWMTGLGVILLTSIGLQILNPQVMRTFLDRALAGDDLSALRGLGLLFIGIAIGQQLLGVLATYLTELLGWSATNQVRLDLARYTLGLDMSFHTAHTPGEMIERIDGDVMALSNFFSQFILQVVANIILIFGVLVVLLREDWRISLVLGVFVGLTLVILLRMVNIAVPSWEKERQFSADLYGFIEERLNGTEDIRSNDGVAYVLQRFYRLTRDLMRITIAASFRWAVVMNTTWVLFAVGNALGLLVSAYLYRAGVITIGSVYMVIYYTNMISWPLERITQQFQDLQKAGASLIRIMGIQQIKGKIAGEDDFIAPATPQLAAGPLAVRFENVSFTYAEAQPAVEEVPAGQAEELVLRDVNFQLAPGRVLGLLGRTGSGKTTLTRLLFRLYDTTQGDIQLGGKSVAELHIQELRRRVGMVTQNIQLFHATLRENLTFFDADISDESVLQALRDLGLWDWYVTLPKGLDTELESGGGGLSAGEAQLLAFTRIFLRDPGLIILDEATSRLDPATEHLIEQAVDKLVQNRTAIVVAHRLGTVQRADDILILEDGHMREFGERQTLASDPGSRFYQLLQIGLEEVLV
jgi:ATP-binding cassette subfamily B protein